MPGRKRADGEYPSVAKVLHAVGNMAPADQRDIHRITVRILENGEATYRLHARGLKIPLGGIVKVD